MAYNANIPQSSDTLSKSQADILANFQAIAPLFEQGIDQWVILPQQASQPTTDSSQVALYSALDSNSVLQLFYGLPSTGGPVNFTGSVKNSQGFTYLPSGLIVRWGSVGVTSTTQTFLLPVGSIPAFTNIFQIFVTPLDSSGNNNFNVGLKSITSTTAFTVYSINPTSATAMIYLIIGN